MCFPISVDVHGQIAVAPDVLRQAEGGEHDADAPDGVERLVRQI